MKTNESRISDIELLIELVKLYDNVDRSKDFNISYELENKIIDIIKNL